MIDALQKYQVSFCFSDSISLFDLSPPDTPTHCSCCFKYYDIESFWKKGHPLDLTGVLLPNAGGSSKSGPALGSPEDLDAFWMGDEDEQEIEEPEDEGKDEPSLPTNDANNDPFWDLDDDTSEPAEAAGDTRSQVDDEDPFWS